MERENNPCYEFEGTWPDGSRFTNPFVEYPDFYPWSDVLDCLINKVEYEELKYRPNMICPNCNKKQEDLLWIFFCSPNSTWEDLCGTKGFMSICTDCNWQVEYIETVMN